MKNLYLPKDTFEAKANSIDNFALRMNKYPPAYVNIKKNVTEFALHHFDKKQKIRCKLSLNLQDSTKQILKFSAKYLHNLSKISNIKLETSYLKPDWKMIVGLGSSSVYETSITLHHIYGFPFIPGQALKGVVRNYVINEYFDKDEKEAEKNEHFFYIFGTQEQQGKVTFFDAYPTSKPQIDFDIMNVHYPKYYSKTGEEPTDDQNPNPLTFLIVKNTSFAFSAGINKNSNAIDFSKYKENSLSDLIKSALEEKGVGAKTAVGYGYLHNTEKKNLQFNKAYEIFNKKEIEAIENAKPLFQKIVEKKDIDRGLEFLKNKENSKVEENAVINMITKYFQDSEMWKMKKLNGQQFDFAISADNFLDLINSKNEKIGRFIKENAGKELKKKYTSAKSKNVDNSIIKPPSNVKEIPAVMKKLESSDSAISLECFENIEKKIERIFKKARMKSNKKEMIRKNLRALKLNFYD